MDQMGKHGELLAQRLAAGSTVGEAIASCGVSKTHGYRLARTAAVRRRVAELRSEAASATVGSLTAAANRAVAVLVEIMDRNDAKDSDRIAAARTVLALLGPISELGEIRERLSQVEQHQKLGVVG